MAQQTIGLGASANDGTGDSLRVAGDKINDNFLEVYGYSASFPQFTTATSTTDYTGTPSPAITAYVTGQRFQIKAHATSTGSATLNLNVLGAKKWYTSPTTQVGTGDVVIDTIYLVAYDATLDSGTGGFLIVGGGGTGGGGTPGGSDTQVQFNDGGAFGGDAGMTYNKTTNTLTIEEIANDQHELAYTTANFVYTQR